MKIKLKTGNLNIDYPQELEELVSFGSRINKKRGFLFVSKVLGKHLPTKPSIMKNIYKKLANDIKLKLSDKPTLVIGFAETATALGHGVYDSLRNDFNVTNSFYIHSTRFDTDEKVFFKFFEEHCHAPSHIFYMPKDKDLRDLLESVENVVLVDDEVSTGNTANNLVNELKKVLPNAKNYYLSTILNWAEKKYDNFEYLSLYQGDFSFEWDYNHKIENNIVSEAVEDIKLDKIIPYNFGRYGVQNLDINFSNLVDIDNFKDKKVLVLGTAEFMYPPYLLALYLEKAGVESYFQATTRSPVNVDGAISSKVAFKDNYFEDIDNFLYNVTDREYDKILICYETTSLPTNFKLKEILESKSFDVSEIFMSDLNING